MLTLTLTVAAAMILIMAAAAVTVRVTLHGWPGQAWRDRTAAHLMRAPDPNPVPYRPGYELSGFENGVRVLRWLARHRDELTSDHPRELT